MGMNTKSIKLAIGMGCILIISSCILFSTFSPTFNQWDNKIAKFFVEKGWKQLSAGNAVTAIVWEYRGYDTLGEESILFTAAIGVFALGFGLFAAEKSMTTPNKKQVKE
jgi:multisubunit Na+/H+ antiporter MnhB subunit